jgi:arylsulfatase A-like enzyme
MSRLLPVLLLLGLLPACGSGSPERHNVVVVLVDQLRADSAEMWMPEVSALAERGIRFENARSVAPWTYPSVISMFSGLYPQQHGADGPPDGQGRILSTFDERLPLLPHLLQRAGYHTAGFVTNPFLHRWNPFHTGFDHYAVDEFIGSEGNLIGQPKLVWTASMFADSVNANLVEYFDARQVDGPEFTYVHYVDVHGPWDDAPFEVGDDSDENYETAVRYVDVKIRELYEYFLARYGGDLIFLVTSDHGRELGDDLELAEGTPLRYRKRSMHEFNLHIPLLILPSEVVREPRIVRGACANIDVYPTLLDWLGYDVPQNIRGISLLPALRGEVLPERALYARQSAFGRLEDALVLDGKKYIRLFDPATGQEARPARRVFDLESDPRESRVFATDFGDADGLFEAAAGTAGVEYPKKYERPSDEVLKQLQGLGYLGEDE